MEIDPEEVSSMYRTLAGAVVPRPIAWVSTTSPEGVDNLAPYSFFNVVAVDPPVVMFAPVDDSESPVAFECSLYEMLDVGGSSMVLGEVEWVHVDDEVTTDGKLDVEKLDAVGRLSESLYATTANRFSMERPP